MKDSRKLGGKNHIPEGMMSQEKEGKGCLYAILVCVAFWLVILGYMIF